MNEDLLETTFESVSTQDDCQQSCSTTITRQWTERPPDSLASTNYLAYRNDSYAKVSSEGEGVGPLPATPV